MADMVPRVCRVLDAIEARDWEQLERLLAPDVHWTAVVAAFKHDPPPAPPSWHEVRGGLITRWIDCPG